MIRRTGSKYALNNTLFFSRRDYIIIIIMFVRTRISLPVQVVPTRIELSQYNVQILRIRAR